MSLTPEQLNLLQSHGIISDNVVNEGDIAIKDWEKVLKWLEEEKQVNRAILPDGTIVEISSDGSSPPTITEPQT